jgi:hypothetical protein
MDPGPRHKPAPQTLPRRQGRFPGRGRPLGSPQWVCLGESVKGLVRDFPLQDVGPSYASPVPIPCPLALGTPLAEPEPCKGHATDAGPCLAAFRPCKPHARGVGTPLAALTLCKSRARVALAGAPAFGPSAPGGYGPIGLEGKLVAPNPQKARVKCLWAQPPTRAKAGPSGPGRHLIPPPRHPAHNPLALAHHHLPRPRPPTIIRKHPWETPLGKAQEGQNGSG